MSWAISFRPRWGHGIRRTHIHSNICWYYISNYRRLSREGGKGREGSISDHVGAALGLAAEGHKVVEFDPIAPGRYIVAMRSVLTVHIIKKFPFIRDAGRPGLEAT